jgi:hypothetical protein
LFSGEKKKKRKSKRREKVGFFLVRKKVLAGAQHGRKRRTVLGRPAPHGVHRAVVQLVERRPNIVLRGTRAELVRCRIPRRKKAFVSKETKRNAGTCFSCDKGERKKGGIVGILAFLGATARDGELGSGVEQLRVVIQRSGGGKSCDEMKKKKKKRVGPCAAVTRNRPKKKPRDPYP